MINVGGFKLCDLILNNNKQTNEQTKKNLPIKE